MNLLDAPIAHESFFATHFFTVSDRDKSKDRILGEKVWRCYMGDPDGCLIEVGQYTEIALDWFNNRTALDRRYAADNPLTSGTQFNTGYPPRLHLSGPTASQSCRRTNSRCCQPAASIVRHRISGQRRRLHKCSG